MRIEINLGVHKFLGIKLLERFTLFVTPVKKIVISTLYPTPGPSVNKVHSEVDIFCNTSGYPEAVTENGKP